MTFPAPNPPVPNPPPPQPPSPPPPPPFDLGHEEHAATVVQAVLLGFIIFLSAITIAFLCVRNNPRTVERVSAEECAAEQPVAAAAALQWPSVAETLATRQVGGRDPRAGSCSASSGGGGRRVAPLYT